MEIDILLLLRRQLGVRDEPVQNGPRLVRIVSPVWFRYGNITLRHADERLDDRIGAVLQILEPIFFARDQKAAVARQGTQRALRLGLNLGLGFFAQFVQPGLLQGNHILLATDLTERVERFFVTGGRGIKLGDHE